MADGGQGRFVTLEGGEGAGKSTLARALAERLRARGIAVDLTREPGGSPFAETIRETILSGAVKEEGALTEALLFSAARIDHLEQRIRPALARGEWVICDRFLDSTRVYQGGAGALDPGTLRALEAVTLGGTLPDLTLILDLDPREGLARAARRRRPDEAADRFETETLAFHEKLRAGYLAIAKQEPARCRVLDASLPPEALADAAWAALEVLLPLEENA